MSAGSNFTAIFTAAIEEYQKVTGKPLISHPLADRLGACDNLEDVLGLLRTQAQVFKEHRRGNEKLIGWLEPTVNILFIFSSTLAEGVALVRRLIHSV
jgi:hypothetical protein